MRHEMDILSSHRASLKAIENENVDLKSRLDLMQSIESVLSASQKEVDEILKQKMNAEDLAVMVGTLRRELSNNETRKNELRKQLNSIKNDLRAEQEERKKLQEKLAAYESRNHALMVRLRRFEKTENFDVKESSSDIDSPEPSKRPRLALKHLEGLNTPSPLSNVSLIRISLNMNLF
jgi:chromosome segregation ATPase